MYREHFDPVEKDIRVTFVLKGEEATEFRRYAHRRNLRTNLAAKNLLIKGMVSIEVLPKWWERRAR